MHKLWRKSNCRQTRYQRSFSGAAVWADNTTVKPRHLNVRRTLCCVIVGSIIPVVGCSNARTISHEMWWSIESLPYPSRPLPPGAVRLTFEDSPKYHVVVVSPGLRSQLQAMGKKKVSVDFRVHERLWGGGKWFNIVAIDGRPFADIGESYMESVGVSRRDIPPF